MMITLDHVSLLLGSAGLRDLSLDFEPGSWTFIIGPSGAGKTLALETLAGLHTPDSGRVLISGRDAEGIPPESRGVSLVYQDYSLFPHMTVAENVMFGLVQRNVSQKDREQRVDTLIQQFHLGSIRDRYPHTLSGGEQQRVAIARALAVQPDILLLDEPFAALDPLIWQEHMLMMQQIQCERKLTVIQVSHSRDEAFALADRVAVIIGGRLVQTGTCEEVFFSPATPEVAWFSGIENIFHGTVTRNSGRTMDVDVNGQVFRAEGNIPSGKQVTLCIRGTDVQMCPVSNPPDPHQTRLNGVINGITPTEHTLRVAIEGPVPLVVILPRDDASRSLSIGQIVTMVIDAVTVGVIPSNREQKI